MKEHYVSYECAKRLHELGFDGVDKYYVTESFCYGGNPDDYYQEGQIVDEYIVYFTNENNEDDFRGVPAPRLDQAVAWLRDKGIHISVNPYMGYDIDANGALYNEYPSWSFELMKVADAEFMNDAKGKHESYESALSAGLDAAIELLGKEVKE